MSNGLIAAGRRWARRAAHALEHHPKQVTALVALLLLGAGGGAFAVASLELQADQIEVRQVLETVQPLPLAEQVNALDVHQFRLYRTEAVRANDSVDTLLARLGVDDPSAAAYLRRDAGFRAQVMGRTGRVVTVEASDAQALHKLTARWVPDDSGSFRRLVIERRADAGFDSRVETAPLVPAARIGSATVRTSLFAAADEARIPDSIIMQVVDIFGGQIDFHRSLRRGDRFNVVYEALEADGEPVRTGRILSAEFENKGKMHQAIWFEQPGQKGAYYSPDGKSMASSYLASPMQFSRVTSGFAMRMHPILRHWKAHLGVDYGAATGTPVRSVGDGVVEFAGVQNGFGKVVIIKHSKADQTVYAHLSQINVRAGQSVSQGQNIGAVGATGWATGPHLHFEFRVNGVHRDPLQVARQGSAQALSAQARPAFDRLARSMRAQLDAAATMTITASAD